MLEDMPPPDPIREEIDRKAVIDYQANFLIETFGISSEDAIRLIARHGVNRRHLLKGLQAELGKAANKRRRRGRPVLRKSDTDHYPAAAEAALAAEG